MIIQSLFDNVRLLKSHMQSSFRQFIIASIGLIIALSVLSSSVLFVEANREVLLGELLEDSDAEWRITNQRGIFNRRNETFNATIKQTFDNFNFSEKVDSLIQFSVVSESILLTTYY